MSRSSVAAGPVNTHGRLRVREMELLLAIDEKRSISAAATHLGFTQPAASRALKDIEQALRVHLFERDRHRGMVPTPAGELVLERARMLLDDYRALAMAVESYRAGTGGHLRLGVIPLLPAPLIEALVAALASDAHRMTVTLSEGPTTQLIEALQLQKLDVAIARCSTAQLPADLSQEIRFRQEACLLAQAKNPLVRKPRLRFADLAESTWLLPPSDTPSRAAINAMFAAAKLAPPMATIEASSPQLIHRTISANARMLALVPSDVGRDLERQGGVRSIALPVTLDLPPVGLICAKRHRDTPMLRNLRSMLRELLRERRAA